MLTTSHQHNINYLKTFDYFGIVIILSMKLIKISVLATLIFSAVFLISGYFLSDDYFFDQLIRSNQISTPENAFQYLSDNIEFAGECGVKPIYGLTPRYMLQRKHLWCDEGAIVLATFAHKLGYETRLVDVIGDDNDAHHTYLEVFQNGQWKTYDTVLKKAGLTHEQIIDAYNSAYLRGYPRPRPYPRWHNIVRQNNFYLNYLVVKLRGIPG